MTDRLLCIAAIIVLSCALAVINFIGGSDVQWYSDTSSKVIEIVCILIADIVIIGGFIFIYLHV